MTEEESTSPLYESLLQISLERELAFPEEEYRRRIGVVQSVLAAQDLDALVVHNTASSCYLTGYDSHVPLSYAVVVVPREGEPVFTCAELETPNMLYHGILKDIRVFNWTESDNTAVDLAGILKDMGLASSRIAIELSNDENFASGAYDAGSYIELRKALPEAELIDGTRIVLDMRLIKSDQELDYMRVAGTYTQAGLAAGFAAAGVGVNENIVAGATYNGLMSAGSEMMAVDPILLTGWRTGLMPHLPYRRRVLQSGDLVFIECGGVQWRYTCASMRTAVVGQPTLEQEKLADVSIEILETLISEARPGRTGHDVAMEVKPLWKKVPGVHFHEGYGYAIGLGVAPTWCEQARYLAEGDEHVLQPGQTFHLPINPCYPGRFGLGFSETIAITEEGSEVLSPGVDRRLLVA